MRWLIVVVALASACASGTVDQEFKGKAKTCHTSSEDVDDFSLLLVLRRPQGQPVQALIGVGLVGLTDVWTTADAAKVRENGDHLEISAAFSEANSIDLVVDRTEAGYAGAADIVDANTLVSCDVANLAEQL